MIRQHRCLAFLATAVLGWSQLTWAQPQEGSAALAARLASKSAEEQLAALEEVVKLGPSAAEFLPAVLMQLNNADVGVRYEAVAAVGAIGPSAKSAVPQLLKLLQGSELLLKYEALVALRSIGVQSGEIAQAIAPLLSDEDRMIRVEAAATVVALNLVGRVEAIAALSAALSDGREGVRSAAIPWLSQAGMEAVPALQETLRTGSSAAKSAAVEALGNMGPSAAMAVPQLLELAKSDSPALLSSVADALGNIAADPQQSLPVLVKLCQHDSVVVRIEALKALGEFGRSAAGALGQIQTSLTDSDVMVRLAACDALAAMGPEAKSAIAALSAALRDPEGAVTLRACEALGSIGPAALPELQKLLEDPHYGALALQTLELMGPMARPASGAILKHLERADGLPQRNLCLALAAVGADSKSAGPVLRKILNDPMSDARAAAAFTLGRLGDRSAIKDLTNVIEDENPLVRLASAWSLLHMDPGNDEYVKIAVPRLTEALSQPNPQIRAESARTLGMLGERASSAVPALVECLGHDESRPVRIASAIAVSEMGSAGHAAVPQLIALTQDSSAEGRRTAMYCLGRMGTASAAAVPQLKHGMQSGAPQDRVVAAWALLQIQADDGNAALALPILLDAIGREEPRVVVQLVRTASQFAGKHPKVKQAVMSLSTADDPALRAAAAAATERMSNQ